MISIDATDRDGKHVTLEGTKGRTLMEVLRDANIGIEAICGGACSCGTCHVYLDAGWMARLGPRNDDEQAMLDAMAGLVEVREGSRLSCQIQVTEDIDGVVLEIAPGV